MRTTMSTMSQDSGSVYLPPRRGDEPQWFVGRIQQKIKDYVNAPTATQAEKEIAKLKRECSIYEGIQDRSEQVKDAVGSLYKAKEYFKATENRAENIKVDSRLVQLQKDLQILQSTNPHIKKAEDDYFVGQYAIPPMAAQKRENSSREAILPGRSSIPAPLLAARERDLRPAKLLMQVREKNLSLEKMSTPTVTRKPTDQEIIKAEGLENTPFEEQANTIQGYRKQGITITVVDEKETKRQIGTDPDPYNKSNPNNPNYSPKYDLTRNAPADFPKNLNIDSLVDYCKYLGLDHTFAGRKKLAERYGIENYTGSPKQNIKLLAILKRENSRTMEPEPEAITEPKIYRTPYDDLNKKELLYLVNLKYAGIDPNEGMKLLYTLQSNAPRDAIKKIEEMGYGSDFAAIAELSFRTGQDEAQLAELEIDFAAERKQGVALLTAILAGEIAYGLQTGGQSIASAATAKSIITQDAGKVTSNFPKSRQAIDADLTSKGYTKSGPSPKGYITYKGPDGKTVTIKPSGEVITTQDVKIDPNNTDWNAPKYPERQYYDGTPIPDGSHSTGQFVEPYNNQ